MTEGSGPATFRRSVSGGRTRVSISREGAGWRYISFRVWDLRAGETVVDDAANEEVGIVVLSGVVSLSSSAGSWTKVGERTSVFDGKPHAVYLPPGIPFTLTALTDCQVARGASLVSAEPTNPTSFRTDVTSGVFRRRGPAEPHSAYPRPYLITPDEITVEERGRGNAKRTIRHILEADKPAAHPFLVECVTPAGNWSSYPPHKHDQDNPPAETYLEEIYYHRIEPAQGFALQRVYTPHGDDQVIVVEDGTVVAVRVGYHPVVSAPGYELYYLNVMAGPVREWRFTDDPDHEWVAAGWRIYGA